MFRKLLTSLNGSTPICPACGHKDSVRSEFFWDDEPLSRWIEFSCEDCGFRVKASNIQIRYRKVV